MSTARLQGTAAIQDRLVERFNLQRFFRGIGPELAPVVLDRQRVFILPTREGFIFALVLLAMLAGAINYSNSLVFLLTFLLTSLALLGMLYTYRSLAGLVLRPGHVSPVFAGQPAAFEVILHNPDAGPRYALQLASGDAQSFTDLPTGGSMALKLPRPAAKRGWLEMGRFTVSCRYPLGLFRAWSYVDLDMRSLVYPAPETVSTAPPAPRGERQPGREQAEGYEDFRGLRRYIPQDSPRHVHWRTAARNAELMTKQFHCEAGGELWFDWDDLAGLETEARLSRLCRWVLDASGSNLRYGLRLPGHIIKLSRGEAHDHVCLRALALFGVAT